MKRAYKKISIIITQTILVCTLFISCKKQQEWLEIKANLNSVTPERINEFQALLDYDVNFMGKGLLTVISAAPYYLTNDQFNAITVGIERNTYTWNKQIYEGRFASDWEVNYKTIAIANITLEGILKTAITPSNKSAYNQVKGTSHYFRAAGYLNLIQAFSKHYDANTYNTDLGVILQLTPEFNKQPKRATVKQCYDQIIEDLTIAATILPNTTDNQIRPSSTAAKALLANVYLLMERWDLAEKFASEALNNYAVLMDFNIIPITANIPFATLQNKNPEVIYYAEMSGSSNFVSNGSFIDSTLYQSYHNNDLRKSALFRLFNNRPIFKGFYTGKTATPFGGIATNEIYLIKAESLARLGDHSSAMNVLNSLLQKRWRNGTFTPLTASNANEALSKIIEERRKELPFTGNIAWCDLRRLNKDVRFARTLKRVVLNTVYELAPNSSKYILPIPDEEIRLTGIPQNIRE
ncbi:RagB/SusD family nutrient uptake outer membrane protein [Sediminibacterium sp.]|uniref:RagB/SusD family nutrient uptake outer membrane protein n=1 Tax=Sediminibacterium sp. TaxID=1917865 RepID=UPI00273554DC|nr:RagB/SusD family nutrient uptake outer membrane protein [Sediminibacterium sp.]MDP3567214.1 RagB/SusD family nutrient uptake outer membrane protein [Sediminibacterium sp.]